MANAKLEFQSWRLTRGAFCYAFPNHTHKNHKLGRHAIFFRFPYMVASVEIFFRNMRGNFSLNLQRHSSWIGRDCLLRTLNLVTM